MTPLELVMNCPRCGAPHYDDGVWRTRPHHTHLCAKCGAEFEALDLPIPTVGVRPNEAANTCLIEEIVRSAEPKWVKRCQVSELLREKGVFTSDHSAYYNMLGIASQPDTARIP